MLDIDGIRVAFGTTEVLRGVTLTVAQGEIVCLLGPSGCGKTTLLRVIAGLQKPQAGDVRLDGRSILNVPVHQRGFGLMFQDFALFPHLNVAGNIAFGLKMKGESPQQRAVHVREALERVGLAGFERRDVAQLSGGERQRVALARSLAPSPRLLMLDEPLGSLDAVLRERLVVDLRDIIKRMGLTAIYVTHDQGEAFGIADRVAVMNLGRFEQVDKPETLYWRPSSTFVARFLRLENVFPVVYQDGNIAHTEIGDFSVDAQAEAVLLHPDGLTLTQPGTPDAVQGTITERVFQGDSYRMRVRLLNDKTLTLKLPLLANHVPGVGEPAAVIVSPDWVIPLRH